MTGNEDTTISGNVLSNDTDANNDVLSVAGFSINGVAGTLGAAFTITSVGSLTLNANGTYSFVPVANYTGTIPAISYTLTDGIASTTAILSITVAPVNDPPTSINDSKTVLEDTATLLSLSDFGTYNDIESTPIASVVIASLPGSGTVAYFNGASWVAVTANQTISTADINAGKLRYTPALNSTTSTSLTYNVSDGSATSTSAYTLSIGITGINDAPAGADKTITLNEDSSYTLAAADFGFSDASDSPVNTLASVIITALPRAGSLKLSGVDVTLGQSISAAAITSLVFTPVANANGSSYASFSFKVQDNGGSANGGIDTDPTPNTVTFNVTAFNDAPVANADAASAAYNSSTALFRISSTGNVVTNDSDVDGGALTVTRFNPGATIDATGAALSTSIITGVEAAAYSALSLNRGSVNFIPASGTLTGTGIPDDTTYTRSNRVITTSRPVVVTVGTSLTFSGTPTAYQLDANDTLTVDTSAVAISSASSSGTNLSTTIAVGMSVTGTSLASDARVVAVYSTPAYQIVKLDKTFSSLVPADNYVFAASSGAATAPAVVDGAYGQLSLNTDGSYTYTPTSGPASTTTDIFSYEIRDSSGVTAAAQLVITVSTVSAGPPTVYANTNSATEKYGTANGTGASTAIGNVLTDGTADTASSGATGLRVDQISSQTTTTASSVNSNGSTSTSVNGLYGQLTLLSGGGYTYAVADTNAAVQALNSGSSLTDVFTYRATDSGGSFASTTLTVTVNGANDAPVATNDSGSASEAGGTGNSIAGTSATGSVFDNDSDVDSTSTGWSISAVRIGNAEGSGTAGTVGSALPGSYGQLTLNNNGTYSYTVDETLANSLAAGATATDSFNYTILDQTLGYTDTAVLSITITGANDAPVNTVPAGRTVTSYGTLSFTAGQLAVADVDGNLASSSSVTLVAGQGSLAVAGSGGTVSGAGTLAFPLIISGTQTEVNERLGTLVYTPLATYSGSDSILMTSRDALGLENSDSVAITVSADARALTVTGTTVNEASPYVRFVVSGASGQYVSLALASGTATVGQDASATLEYYDGSIWRTYEAGSKVALVGTSLLVRSAVLQDSSAEGSETLTLTALNQSESGYSGNSTIVDDGTGSIFLANNNTATPNSSDNAGYPSPLDDDRALAVDTILVNEASSHAVFTVSGVANQVVTLTLLSGTATAASDYSASLEYYDGANWVSYASSAAIPVGGKLLVRILILADANYEGPENFGLRATNGSGVGYVGTATIYDDGTGTRYTGNVINSGGVLSPATDATGLDNDLSVVVTAYSPVNEASAYAPFAIEATKGAALQLSVQGSGSAPATVAGFTIQFSYDGTTWSDYSANSTPLVPGTLGSGTDKVFVRVGISSEQETTLDGPETFKLNAVMAAGGDTPLSADAETTLVDAANGTRYSGDFTSGSPATSNAALDDDRPTLSIANVAASEGEFAVFTVQIDRQSNSGISFTPSLTSGTATLGSDTAAATSLEVSTNGGGSWTTVSGAVTIAAGQTSLQLRLAITDDTATELAESFTLSTGTITGSVSNSAGVTATATIATNDAPSLSVSSVSVNEASAYAVVTVSLSAAAAGTVSFTPSLVSGTATSGTDTGSTIEYFTGSDWASATSGVSIATSSTSVLLRVAITQDTTFEGSEGLSLTTGTITGPVSNTQAASGTITILDNGTGAIFLGTNNTATPNVSGDTGYPALDDDQPSFAVADVSVSESAGTATVTVTRTGSTLLSSTISYATSNGTASSSSDYTAASGSLSFAANDTSKTFTVSINNDTLDEDNENLNVTLSSATNAVIGDSTAVVTITDDDTQAVSTIVARDATVASNVIDTSVVEGNSLVYTVTLSAAASVSRTHSFAWSGTASGSDYGAPTFSDGVTLSDSTLTVPAGVASFTVTLATTDDSSIETDETLILTIGGISATGTITDNDSNTVLALTSPQVNEASPYAVFTVSGTSNGLALTLVLAGSTASGSGVDFGAASGTGLSYSTDGGVSWQAYTGSFTATGSSVLVRTPIINDSSSDSGETFTLTATPASGTAASGTATIVDNATGSVFAANGSLNGSTTLDDDRALSISSFALNEASPYIVWTVQGTSGQVVSLSLSGTATGSGEDYGGSLQVLMNGNWVAYDSNQNPAISSAGTLRVRTSLVDDAISDDGETVILSARPVGGQTATGTATIRDEGSGTVYNADGIATALTATNDLPTISVTSVSVQEREPYAITSISLSQTASSAISFTPILAAGSATLGADFGPGLEYFDGSVWTSAAAPITIAPGVTSIQVRTPLVQDTLTNEGTERFTISTGAVTGPVRNATGATGNISIIDAIIIGGPVITDVTESPTDPTPSDLFTADTTQVVTLTGEAGATVSLFRTDNAQSYTQVAVNQFQTTETAPGVYRLDFGTNVLQAGDYVARLTKSGTNSGYSNSFTLDSTPGLYDIAARRENVDIAPGVKVANGAVGGLDQGRLPTFWTGSEWRDSDGEIIRFAFGAPAQFDKTAPPAGTGITATAASGSTLALNTQTGRYTYTPGADATIDTFTIFASDGTKGDKLKLTFDNADSLDRDGVPANVETRLAQLANATGVGGDLNNDGIADANQNAVTTLAWTTVDKFNAALDGSLNDVKPIISLQVLQSGSGRTVDDTSQLTDVKVLRANSSVVGGSKPANATWDPIQFAVESTQSVGLLDIDPIRAGTQIRIVLDIANTQVAAGTFTRYMKYVDATAIAGGAVVGLGGQAITTPGWYDYTQRTAGGDGARFITAGGFITGIELIFTDNAFGDNDPTVGRIFDPGVPTDDSTGGGGGGGADTTPPVITGPSNGPGAASSAISIPENTQPVAQFSADEPVSWSISAGADASAFTLDATSGALIFSTAPDFEAPTDQGRNNIYDLIITATDLSGNATRQTVSVTVTDVDDTRPIITGPSNGPGAASSAISIPENTRPVAQFSGNEPVRWSISGGADASAFTLDATSGTLSFSTAPNFEASTDQGRNNIYDLIITATDLSGNATRQTVAVTVTDVDDAPPIITVPINKPSLSAISIPENMLFVATLGVSEPSVWAIAGGADGDAFFIDPQTGALSFKAAPDFELPRDAGTNNVYDVVIAATDRVGLSSTQAIAVTVTDVDDVRPVITGPSNGPGAGSSATSIPENTRPVAQFSANESVLWSISGGVDARVFTLDAASGALSFSAPPDFEAPTDQGRNNVYDLIVTARDPAGNVSTQTVEVSVTNIVESLPVYAQLLVSGDHLLTVKQADTTSGTTMRIEFYGTTETGPNTRALAVWVNLVTGDYFYAPEGNALPYDCYVPVAGVQLPRVLAAGTGAFDVHLYMNGAGTTQIMGEQSARALNLLGQDYQDLGVLFASVTPLTDMVKTQDFWLI